MKTIERRIETLEAITDETALGVCWLQDGESQAEAIARKWPDGAPRGRVLLLSWEGEINEGR